MKNSFLIGTGLFLLLNGSALAMPGQSQMPEQEHANRFKTMDTNDDSMLVWAEFEAAMPQMRKEAFDAIDTNKDGSIAPDEWEGFRKTHGMKGGMAPGGMAPGGMAPGGMAPGGMAPSEAPTSTKPLIQPPKN